MIKAYFYDSSGLDHEIDLSKKLRSISTKQLLWIDVIGREQRDIGNVGKMLKLSERCMSDLKNEHSVCELNTYGGYLHFDVASLKVEKIKSGTTSKPFPDAPSSLRLDFVVGKQWLLTVHDEDLAFLKEFRDQDRGQTLIGKLTPAGLASSLLDWHLSPYLTASEEMEQMCDALDEQILAERKMASDLLPYIVLGQRYITGLRRLLVPQRSVFYGLSRADIALITDNSSNEQLKSLEHRFERALDIVEHGREVVRSSFTLYSARTGDKTNTLIRRFTFLSITLGVIGAVAGLFGMNFDTPYTHSGLEGFWIVVILLFSFISMFGLVSLWRRWI